MASFKDQVALVTGGGSGIGAALSRELAARGAKVVIGDLAVASAESVASTITKAGGSASAHALDVTDANAVAALVSETVQRFGRLDLIFNTAGISIAGDARDLTVEHYRQVLEVNLMGVVYGADAAYKQMAKQGHGHIINIASLAGLIPFATNVPYATSKHAVVGLSLSLRAEGADLGVKVSAVCPGFIQTNIFNASRYINFDKAKALAHLPFKPISSDEAARQILHGVECNTAIIIFPGYARWVWRLHRLAAGLLGPMNLKGIRDLRKIRQG